MNKLENEDFIRKFEVLDAIRKAAEKRRNHPIELRELRLSDGRDPRLRIISAPIAGYEMGEVEREYLFGTDRKLLAEPKKYMNKEAVPIRGLWEPVLGELQVLQHERFEASIARCEKPMRKGMRGIFKALGITPASKREEAAAHRKAIAEGLPEIHIPSPMWWVCLSKVVKCITCGADFFYTDSHYSYCSEACERASPYRRVNAVKYIAARSKKRAEARAGTKCGHCGKAFEPKRSTAKFCSTLCRVKNFHANRI